MINHIATPDVTPDALRKVNSYMYQRQDENISEKNKFPICFAGRQI